MSYATDAELLQEIPEAELIRLTDDRGEGKVDTSVTLWALDRATATIEAHIPADCGLTVPLSPPPTFIRDICVLVAHVELMGRKRVPLDEVTKERFQQAMRMLVRLSEGKISLQTGLPVQSTEAPRGEAEAEDRVFTRDELNGM